MRVLIEGWLWQRLCTSSSASGMGGSSASAFELLEVALPLLNEGTYKQEWDGWTKEA
jgi:hypothetical protein